MSALELSPEGAGQSLHSMLAAVAFASAKRRIVLVICVISHLAAGAVRRFFLRIVSSRGVDIRGAIVVQLTDQAVGNFSAL